MAYSTADSPLIPLEKGEGLNQDFRPKGNRDAAHGVLQPALSKAFETKANLAQLASDHTRKKREASTEERKPGIAQHRERI